MPDLPERLGPLSSAVNGVYESSSASDDGDGSESAEDAGESGTTSKVDRVGGGGGGTSEGKGTADDKAASHVGGTVYAVKEVCESAG